MKKIHSHSIILCCAMIGLVLPLVLLLNPTKNDNTRFKINLKEQPKNVENLKQKVNDTGNSFLNWIGGEQKQDESGTNGTRIVGDEKSSQRLDQSNLQTSQSRMVNNNAATSNIQSTAEQTNESGNISKSDVSRFTNNIDQDRSHPETSKGTVFCFNGNVGFINFRSSPVVDVVSRDSLNRDRYTLYMAQCDDEIEVIQPAFMNNGIRWYVAYYHGQFGYIAANAVKINHQL